MLVTEKGISAAESLPRSSSAGEIGAAFMIHQALPSMLIEVAAMRRKTNTVAVSTPTAMAMLAGSSVPGANRSKISVGLRTFRRLPSRLR